VASRLPRQLALNAGQAARRSHSSRRTARSTITWAARRTGHCGHGRSSSVTGIPASTHPSVSTRRYQP